jgi:hypothetical protein
MKNSLIKFSVPLHLMKEFFILLIFLTKPMYHSTVAGVPLFEKPYNRHLTKTRGPVPPCFLILSTYSLFFSFMIFVLLINISTD